MNRYALYLIAAMLLVGSNVGVGKSVVAFIPVSLFALLRFVIAMAVLWPLLRPAKIRMVKRGEWVNLFQQAFFGTFMFTLLMLNGVQRTSAVAAGVITSTIPAVVALFSWFFLKERPNGLALISIVLAIAGVVVINVAQGVAGASQDTSLLGNLMVLGAVCCESYYVILSRRLTQTLPAIDICAYTHFFGLLLMLPLGFSALVSFDYSGVSLSVWSLVLWYGFSANIFSFWLWMKGIRHVDGSLAGVFCGLLPIAAELYGMVFLDERPTIAHGIALACVVAGIVLASLKAKTAPSMIS
ncbi:MAG: Permease of the drug/metabolite transporter (DMT) superfamily [Candidatus Burkholderia crenata]|nr:MAG: Permease of the drug/metabolite transporter (DMT) superfamily [Candidatus Burkholderia crenata]